MVLQNDSASVPRQYIRKVTRTQPRRGRLFVRHLICIRSICPGTERLTTVTRRSLFTSVCVTPQQNIVGYWNGTAVHSKASPYPLLCHMGPTRSRSELLPPSQCVFGTPLCVIVIGIRRAVMVSIRDARISCGAEPSFTPLLHCQPRPLAR